MYQQQSHSSNREIKSQSYHYGLSNQLARERRNSSTSLASMASSQVSASVSSRNLATDSLLTIDDRFRRKPVRTAHTQQLQLHQRRSNSMTNIPSTVQRHQMAMRPPRSVPSSPVVQSEYYFPNGEVFRPRQNPKRRTNRPNKVKPPTLEHFSSMPNLAGYSQQFQQAPSRQQSVRSTRSVRSMRPPPQVRPAHLKINTQIAQGEVDEQLSLKRLSNASSSSEHHDASVSSSSAASISALNSSSSPSPSRNTTDTPVSSINNDDVYTKEPIIVESPLVIPIVVTKTETPPEKKQSGLKRFLSKLFKSKETTTRPQLEKKSSRLSLRRLSSKPAMTPIIKKSVSQPNLTSQTYTSVAPPPQPPVIQEEEEYPSLSTGTTDEDNDEVRSFEIGDDCDAKLKSLGRFEIDFEKSLAEIPQTVNSIEEEPIEEETVEVPFSSVVDGIGETSFPDLAKEDLGQTRRLSLKKKKSMERKKSLSRSDTTSSNNSAHSSVLTARSLGMSLELESHEINSLDYHSRLKENHSEDDSRSEVVIVTTNTIKRPNSGLPVSKSCLRSSASVPSKTVSFSNSVYLNDTYSYTIYDRFNFGLKQNYLKLSATPNMIKDIRMELNNFKATMDVHDSSRQYTQFFHA